MSWETQDLLAKLNRDRDREERERVRAAEERTASRIFLGIAKWIAGPVAGLIVGYLWDRL